MNDTKTKGAHRRRRTSVNATSAGLITTALTVVNLVVGFGFQSLIAYALGLGTLADQFQLTWAVVTFGATVFLALVSSVLVPRMHKGKHEHYIGDRRFLSYWGLLLTACQLLSGVVVGGDLGALLVTSAPSHLLASLSASPLALAYLTNRFAIAAMGNVYNGIGLVSATSIAYAVGIGPIGLGLALTAGYVCQYICTAVPMRTATRSAKHDAIIGLRVLSGLIAFTMLTKLQPLLERVVAESLGIGSTAALGFGQKISQGLLLLGAFGLALTATGSLSKAYANKDYVSIRSILSRTLTTTLVATLSIMALFIPVSQAIIQVLFQRGAFTSRDTTEVFSIFLAQTPWVVACALTGVLTSYMYVARQYKNVAISSVVGLLSTVVASVALREYSPKDAGALASSCGAVATLIYAYLAVRRDPLGRLGIVETRRYRALNVTVLIAFALTTTSFFALRTLDVGIAVVLTSIIAPLTFAAGMTRTNVRLTIKELSRARLD